ncbi:siderophore-interacting protein [Chromobacterium subtsugae]|uniref:Siderophore-interacting protein n=3 Tax=Chromobacterium subtsugae TaxID=251747 RepID=A0ABS7FH64_9NEIS|nr:MULTISPECIES: siderophore-interacting protein [Chromobacterium]KUM02699.1 FAD-binding protein [Chromobacterium subtsugae]KZE84917.1 FAD-binding protein [Chromobacterium sp. F49]MBW7567869.1 siderophore-interacting protein [Chromobacterium subtsugae]MBW8289096.1 siderophore-interacting protein [Chromobacterium subtsugae]OBU85420.1 FAD-binding protein [Chromobacterium subtsugae]
MRHDLTIQKLRHPLQFRLLRVSRIERLAGRLLRVTLSGADLEGFASSSFDDHVKLFFPAPGEIRPVSPSVGEGGIVFPADQAKPAMRDYTPRRYAADAGELDIDFVLHEGGVASDWAAQAQVGHYLGVGGPRGSRVVPTGFDWHWLIGDETALPAISRRLEELPADSRGAAVILVDNADARLPLGGPAGMEIIWRQRDRRQDLLQTVTEMPLPGGDGYVWAAGESGEMRAVHKHLQLRGVDKDRMRVAGYWKRGDAGAHETIGE